MSSISSVGLEPIETIPLELRDGTVTSYEIVLHNTAEIALRKFRLFQAYKNWFNEQLTRGNKNCKSLSQCIKLQLHVSQKLMMYIITRDGNKQSTKIPKMV